MTTVHHAAASGFGKAAEAYQRGRPDYPEAIGGWLGGALALEPGKVVVDLGAGTGKFTERLVATGAEVIAVEPVEAMRAQLTARLPQVRAVDGTAQGIPLPDASVDAVVCAQAFHWFATAEALREIRRVLKPGGALGLVWNVRDDRVEWVRELTALMMPHEAGAPRYHSGAWRRVFPAAGFAPLEETAMPHEHVGPAEHVVVDRTMSISFIASMAAEPRAAFEAELRQLVAETPALQGETVRVPYTTFAYLARAV
jgi:SAM-dependent methyltransferase